MCLGLEIRVTCCRALCSSIMGVLFCYVSAKALTRGVGACSWRAPGSCGRDSAQPYALRAPALPAAAVRTVATSAAADSAAQSTPHRSSHGGPPSQACTSGLLSCKTPQPDHSMSLSCKAYRLCFQ